MEMFLKTTKENEFVKVQLKYSLGGINYATYQNEERGYYLHVTPVTRERGFESYIAFTGVKKCILPVSRKSKKAEEKAIVLAETEKQKLIEYVCKQNGIELVG